VRQAKPIGRFEDGELGELEELVVHGLSREFQETDDPGASLPARVLNMLRECRGRLARLAADWIRVSYYQGNFDSDNCAVGGQTLNYGPFGFAEKCDPDYQPWVGGGEDYASMNVHNAMCRNFQSLCQALVPLVEGKEGGV
jgi:Uncharacterized conserved protein